MKIMLLLLKRIFNNPFMFIVIVFQTAFISVALLASYNAYMISHACIDSVSGENRMIYRSRSSDFIDIIDNNDTEYISATDGLMKGCNDYLGASFVADGLTYFGDNASLEIAKRAISGQAIPEDLAARAKYTDFATTYFYNEITLKSIKYPLSKGDWENIFEEENGVLPCFIGGSESSKYQVGDIINGYTFTQKDGDIIEVDYVIAGILKEPLFLLSANSGQTDLHTAMKISEIFRVGLNEPIVLIANSDLAEKHDVQMTNVRGNYFVFFDGDTSDEHMEEYAIKLGDAYASVDKDMILSEEMEITRGAEVILPVVVLMLLISLSAVVSVSVISFLDGMREYKVYYIFGCTRGKMLIINALYSLCYLVMSGLLSIVFAKIMHAFSHNKFKPYFEASIEASILLAAGFALTIAISVAISFAFQRNKNIKELMLISVE